MNEKKEEKETLKRKERMNENLNEEKKKKLYYGKNEMKNIKKNKRKI